MKKKVKKRVLLSVSDSGEVWDSGDVGRKGR